MRQAAASLNPESQSAGEWLGWMTFLVPPHPIMANY